MLLVDTHRSKMIRNVTQKAIQCDIMIYTIHRLPQQNKLWEHLPKVLEQT